VRRRRRRRGASAIGVTTPVSTATGFGFGIAWFTLTPDFSCRNNSIQFALTSLTSLLTP
jgi:hypothetical protein